MHWVGSRDYGPLYLNFIKSQNSFLFKQYPSHFSGNVDNHIDAPFSWCMLFSFSCSSDKEFCNFYVFCRGFSTFIFFFSIFIFPCLHYKLYFVLTEDLLMVRLQLLSLAFIFSDVTKSNNTHPTIFYWT